MVKHNNVIPNLHFHKKYCQSSRGPLKVKLALNQATRKKVRRLRRAAKAAAIAPRPLQKLRPVVHCQTQRYSSKVRLGRGFSVAELKAAKLHPSYAQTVGIAVDLRRVNRSEESFDLNVARLEEYKKNLVVFTKKSTPSETPAQIAGTIQPIANPSKEIVMESVTSEMKDFKAYTTMRVAKKETKVAGLRVSVANRKDKK
uniref:60S ribosomal protein L13 n=1 Tax=Thalassionema nitzschioides TaxID=33649 RepID=A0A6V0XAY0_9STRA|mmetsp:Transcript_1723/g.2538  ORF Transcript_1723/g.2538 Transcript_1723/m.2538 type:complete len:200 (-) Transcript_1723:146-745(-)|eukprot:CAMPEP_0194205520 /NCGR_PEP_ID=MMETSP0156-20130528/4766_1 /TAXON_ID=33649 /ORGANISM="Thalassionema nitzschioides, Strain L26-B" /LENGTH=199 /DNA_ID=CAMNT_0038931809 /DNA_START=250 /DNA_END=849 /DNA_ORIENTATION=+